MGIENTIATEHEISAAAFEADQDLMTAEIAKEAYGKMLLLRRFEEKCGQLVALGVLGEFASMATSREGIPVSMALARMPGEVCVTATGVHSTLLALGIEPEAVFADLVSGTGYPNGEVAKRNVHFRSTSKDALAKAATEARSGAATFCWIDATREDRAACFAALSNLLKPGLPLIVLAHIEADAADCLSSPPGLLIVHADCADAGRIKTYCCEAAERARQQDLPALILVRTMGFQGHVAADRRGPGARQPSRETWDPIARLRLRLLDEYRLAEADLKAMEKAVRDRITSAAAAARACD